MAAMSISARINGPGGRTKPRGASSPAPRGPEHRTAPPPAGAPPPLEQHPLIHAGVGSGPIKSREGDGDRAGTGADEGTEGTREQRDREGQVVRAAGDGYVLDTSSKAADFKPRLGRARPHVPLFTVTTAHTLRCCPWCP